MLEGAFDGQDSPEESKDANPRTTEMKMQMQMQMRVEELGVDWRDVVGRGERKANEMAMESLVFFAG